MCSEEVKIRRDEEVKNINSHPHILKSSHPNYFQLLSIPQSFTVDFPALESAYFSAQRAVHPDKAGLEGVQKSVAVNEAYQTLKDPLKRAKHLLALQGITVLDEANSAKPDMATLNEIMELQEAKADADTSEKSDAFKVKLQELTDNCLAGLERAFEKSEFEAAKTLAIRLSYLYKLSTNPV